MNHTQVGPIVRVIGSEKTWIETKAIDQLNHTAQLPGMVAAIGQPDLHPGNQWPVGAVFATEQMLYPALAGSDIGCGMSLYQTSLGTNKIKLDKLVHKLSRFEDSNPNDLSSLLASYDLEDSPFNEQLGTIGGGNHFAELQSIETIYCDARFNELNLSRYTCYLLVHSGSRHLGHSIYQEINHVCGQEGFNLRKPSEKEAADAYMQKHRYAITWARANRDIIAQKMFELMACTGQICLDICHNSIQQERWGEQMVWAHRKGASSSQSGPVVIPGSRGHFTYLVQPIGDQAFNGYSLAHGAGRKWQRSVAKANLSKRYSIDDLTRTSLGSRVICEDRQLIYEEAPKAYKNIETIIQDLVDLNLIKLIARLKPIVTYKTSRGGHDKAKG